MLNKSYIHTQKYPRDVRFQSIAGDTNDFDWYRSRAVCETLGLNLAIIKTNADMTDLNTTVIQYAPNKPRHKHNIPQGLYRSYSRICCWGLEMVHRRDAGRSMAVLACRATGLYWGQCLCMKFLLGRSLASCLTVFYDFGNPNILCEWLILFINMYLPFSLNKVV